MHVGRDLCCERETMKPLRNIGTEKLVDHMVNSQLILYLQQNQNTNLKIAERDNKEGALQ